MKILHVATEYYPLLKTGGLADVVGALPKSQAIADPYSETRILLPGFPDILNQVTNLTTVATIDTFAGPVTLLFGDFENSNIYIINAPHLYGRSGSPYHDDHMNAYSDNYLRFALLGFIACELACGLDSMWRAELVHAHDWHAGLACAYLAARDYPALCVFTVHNLAYQGLFYKHHLSEIGLPSDFYHINGLEFHGQISYLKAGLVYANHVTTVSPTYALEITQPELGCGMHNILKIRHNQGSFTGILNGVDDSIWNPEHDLLIEHCYDAKDVTSKQKNKSKLQVKMGLTNSNKRPLFGIISRLTEQKGLDWVLDILPIIIKNNAQIVILGAGDNWLQDKFQDAALTHPKHIAIKIGYDEKLSHQIMASADVIMVPSRFEPCGLTQLYGLKYGTLPLVRNTGGLADTVVDCSLENINDKTATGFMFYDTNANALDSAFRRAIALWAQPISWKLVQQTAMKKDFNWHTAANEYLQLYRDLF